MKTEWSAQSPNIQKDSNDELCVTHNHYKTIDYKSFSFFRDRAKLRQLIEQDSTSLKGCIAFFKRYAEDDENVPAIGRALAASIVAEDECRLKEFQSHRPSSCVIL